MIKNACVVGCGAISPVHARALTSLPNAALYAVCDIDQSHAAALSDRFGGKIYTDFETALSDPSLDTVHICTPHYLHPDMACRALYAGKDVLLEKPAAIDAEGFGKLLDAKKATGRQVGVCFQNRTNTCIQMLYDLVKTDKTLGALTAIAANLRWHRTPEYYQSANWRGRWATEGGGVLINQAVHLLDLAVQFGGVPLWVQASISTKSLGDVIEVEDTADARIRFVSGVEASFYATNAFPVNQPFFLELVFEAATLRYADNRLYRVTKAGMETLCADNAEVPGKPYWGGGHKHVISDFYRALEKGSQNYLTLESTIDTFRTLFGIYKSAKTGAPVTL